MFISILLLVIIFLSLGGIFYIISRKISILSNLDLTQVPKERKKRLKRDLIAREAWQRIEWLQDFLKQKGIFIKKFYQQINLFLKQILIFLKNALKFIRQINFWQRIKKIFKN
jgi:hypothetical protein